MNDLSKIYDVKWAQMRLLFKWRAGIMGDVLRKEFSFNSYVDVGCAIGDMVEDMLLAGKQAMGVEGSLSVLPYIAPAMRQYVVIGDLRETIRLGQRFDLATCFEVAEHIDPEFTNVFLSNLCGMSDRLVMSICMNGETGRNHVNFKRSDEWDGLFSHKGYHRDDTCRDRIKNGLAPYVSRGREMGWWHDRLVVYKRG